MARLSVPLLLVPAAAVALASGCVSPGVKTEAGMADTDGPAGISYYMPMRFAKVTFLREKADEKADKALADANTALAEAKAKEVAAKAAVVAHDALVTALKADGFAPTDAAFQAARVELVKARTEEAAATKAVAAATAKQQAAQAAANSLANAKAMCGWVDSIKVQLLDPVPDTSARYLLQPQSSDFRSDTWKLKTTAGGLLQSADVELKDESTDVLVNLAKSFTSVSGPPTNRTAPRGPKAIAASDCNDYAWSRKELEQIIDPASPSDWSKVSTAISGAATVAAIKGGTSRTFDYKLNAGTTLPGRPASARKSADGVFYRRELPVVVNISEGTSPVGGFLLLVPNAAPVESINLQAKSFVTNKSTLGFSNGMLVAVDETRPSAALAIAAVPLRISEAVLKQVQDLLTARIEISKKSGELTTADTELLKRTVELLEAQRTLDEARVDDAPQ